MRHRPLSPTADPHSHGTSSSSEGGRQASRLLAHSLTVTSPLEQQVAPHLKRRLIAKAISDPRAREGGRSDAKGGHGSRRESERERQEMRGRKKEANKRDGNTSLKERERERERNEMGGREEED